MKAEVGYITAWRRGIFFSLVAAIIFFGLAGTITQAYVETILIRNIVGVFALLVGIVFVILIVADPKGIYEGQGELEITTEQISYKDKKRSFNIKRENIKSIDIKPVYFGQNEKSILAFHIIIDTGKKKYYIESDRAKGRKYDEVGLYKLYLYLQENVSK